MNVVKIKLEFEGWHCIPKKETKTILEQARAQFCNANFIDNCGLLIETTSDEQTFKFCLDTIEKYKNYLGSWDGYNVRRISKRIVYNYQDKKRKLSFDYFKRLVTENAFEEIKIVLAGILYLNPDETKVVLSTIERDLGKLFLEMKDDELKIAYGMLIKFSSTSARKFSLDFKERQDAEL